MMHLEQASYPAQPGHWTLAPLSDLWSVEAGHLGQKTPVGQRAPP